MPAGLQVLRESLKPQHLDKVAADALVLVVQVDQEGLLAVRGGQDLEAPVRIPGGQRNLQHAHLPLLIWRV